MAGRMLLVAGLTALLLLTVGVTAPAAAQDVRPINDSGVGLNELQRGGTIHAGAPPSMRFMSTYGSATLRHTPIGFGSAEWDYVSRGERINRDQVTLKTVRLGNPDETLNVHVVGWNKGSREVRSSNTTTTQPIARNVTEQVVQVNLGRGYDNATVPLPASYDSSQQITMWVEEYPDTRWRFSHRSVATSQPIQISTWGGFLSTLFWKIGIFALPAMLIGGSVAKRHRDRALVGPQWGLWKWAAAFAVPLGLFATQFAVEGAAIASRLPQAIGVLFGPAAYALVLEGNDHELDKILFRRQDLEHAKSPRGEDTHDSRYVDHVVKRGVHRAAEEELVLIEKGMMPYLARLWGHLATLDISAIETHKKGKHSRFALEIELDPDYDIHDALIHKPPGLNRLPLSVEGDVPYFGSMTIPNPGVVLPLGIPAVVGWFAADYALGIAWLGAAAGVIVGLPWIYSVEHGGAESEPAPYHSTQAEASLAAEAEQYAEAKALDEFREIAWREKMKTPLEALQASAEFDETASRRLNERMLGDEWTQEVKSAGDPSLDDPGVSDGD